MANKPDQSTDVENSDSPGDPNMAGNAPTAPVQDRRSQAFRRDPQSQVIQPGYDAPDTCDNDRYAYFPTPEPTRRPG